MTGEDNIDGDGRNDDPADPLDAAGVDPVVPEAAAADAASDEFADDAEVRAFLRTVADDVRSDSSESKQLSAILYRVSDLYDTDEQTSPEEIYLNVRHIMQIKAQGGIER
ncbi:hypothetical protein EXE53_23285 [Halorubrum sp. SD626R]|uniref:hypothetical protein n=1 Tax=Halorubrum TaxID=56688 RepID=UPI0010F4E583|nr:MULTISPECIES: hypothetical protein [Halorubrum]TKX78047.1 hypothetical protein EXE53_23285 [Halorubrum sp. SD626R]